ncbi:MAG: CaiB/BaiF CoA transferase family protein [Geminicoccales bacterium]
MKLDGIKVLDLSLFLPGPQMTAMMVDHGADVLKVEPKAGDPSRQMAPFERDQSVWFRTMNRGKRSVALDLKSEAGLTKLYDLVREADVFVEAFRPGVAKRLKIDYPTLSALNSGLVYCSISAFGQEGPLSHHPAHDMAVEAFTGFMSVNDDRAGAPVVPAVPAADLAASLTALSGVLMALIGREKTGKGDYLDIAMFDSLVPWCGHMAGPAIVHKERIRSDQQRSLGGAAFYQVYETADGRHIVLGGREEKFVRNLLGALDRPDLIEACLGEAGEGQRPAVAFLSETFKQKTLAHWIGWFEDVEVCFAPVLDFVEAFESEQMMSRAMILVGPNGEHVIGNPIKFLEEPASVSMEAPALDQASDSA